MKPIIVIIDDNQEDVEKIKQIFSSYYDFFPLKGSESNKFLNNVRDAINNKNPNRNEAERKVKASLDCFSNRIATFIIDYRLEEIDEEIVTISGLKFYLDFLSINYPTKSCVILTNLKEPKELNIILDKIDEVNNKMKLTLRLKQLNDTNFRNFLNKFVNSSNPVTTLIHRIKDKSIRDRSETLTETLNDIEKNFQIYKDDIIFVLNEFADFSGEINNSIQDKFIKSCNNLRI